jgi:hypothetical protein
MTKEKNGKAKEKKVKKERQPHPFGPPEARAKGYAFPSTNPILQMYAGKTAEKLPTNLQEVFAAIAKHASGVSLKDLKVAKLGDKTLHWLVRQLCKHEYVRVKAEEKPGPKKAVAKKEEK